VPRQDYTIRGANDADADALTDLKVRMGDQHHAYDAEVWAEGARTADAWRKEFAEQLRAENARVLVAESSSGECVGFVTCRVYEAPCERPAARAGLIGELVIHPDHQRRGLGARLMEAALEALGKLGAEDVTLHVAVQNEHAVRFYERLGFRIIMHRMFMRLHPAGD